MHTPVNIIWISENCLKKRQENVSFIYNEPERKNFNKSRKMVEVQKKLNPESFWYFRLRWLKNRALLKVRKKK